jgi:hypothetical protein
MQRAAETPQHAGTNPGSQAPSAPDHHAACSLTLAGRNPAARKGRGPVSQAKAGDGRGVCPTLTKRAHMGDLIRLKLTPQAIRKINASKRNRGARRPRLLELRDARRRLEIEAEFREAQAVAGWGR